MDIHATTKRANTVRASRRDLELLSVIGDQYAITLPQLALLIGGSIPGARSLCRRWQRAGWVESQAIVRGEPALVWLTRAGQRLAGLGYRFWRPSPGVVAHLAAVNEVRMFVQRRRPEAVWLSERRLACEETRRHRPDAVVFAEGHEIPIEVELTPKTRKKTLSIIGELLRGHEFVWYFAAPRCRAVLDDIAAGFTDGVVQVLDLPSESL